MSRVENISADSLVERRKLRRSRTMWRVLTVVLFAALGLAVVANTTGLMDRIAGPGEHVARVELSGFIDFDDEFIDLIEEIEEDEDVKAVILRVNSPGGLSVAGETIYTALRALGDEKPLVAVVDGVGTSAAYLAASASEHIVARNNSVVGSIGVMAQFPDVSGLLETVGVTVYEIRSGELKAQPSMFNEPSEEALAELESLIADNFTWFVDQVAQRRGLDGAVIRGFEGTVFTGSRGVQVGLVDTIGGEDEALDYLVEAHSLDDDIDIVDRAPDRPVALGATGAVSNLVLGDGQSILFDAEQLQDSIRDAMLLDGLMSLWHGR